MDFLATRDDDPGIAGLDLLHADGNGAKARPAKLVEPPGGRLVRTAGETGGLAGRVLSLAGRQDLAHYHLVHITGVDAGTHERFLDGSRAQFMRRNIGEGAVEGTHRACARHPQMTIEADMMLSR